MEKANLNTKQCFNTESSALNNNMTKFFKKRFPIISWLPNYSLRKCVADAIAGLTVGLTVVPQSMAYAAIAGLSPEYGLYSSYIGCFLYIFLGSCRQVTIGPTAVMGLLTYETCGANSSECAILAGFYSGIFELIMAFLHLGWIVSFISEPVKVGFTSAAAVTIISSQLSNLLGLRGRKGKGFVGYCASFVKNITSVQISDATLGLISLVVLIILKKCGDLIPPPTRIGKVIKSLLWFISVSRNVVIILASSTLAYFWTTPNFQLTGHVQGGFPTVGLPQFKLPIKDTNSFVQNFTTLIMPTNGTSTIDMESTKYLSFGQTWDFLGAGPLVIAVIAVLQNVAISKAFGNGQSIDATQEMFALGISNTVGGFFSAIPISGSFSRSAVNDASGVRTTGGGFYTGIIVLLSLSFLTPSFYFIPKASLAAVIICAVVFMIDFMVLVPMWKISRMDFIACLVTFCSALIFGMEYGILIGVTITLVTLLVKSLRPNLNFEVKTDIKNGVQYLLIEPSDGVQFPSMSYFRSSINKLIKCHDSVKIVVLNFSKWSSWDFTCTSSFVSLNEELRKSGRFLVFLHCKQDWIEALKEAGITNIKCFDNSYLEECLRKVMHIRSTSFLNFRIAEGIEDFSRY